MPRYNPDLVAARMNAHRKQREEEIRKEIVGYIQQTIRIKRFHFLHYTPTEMLESDVRVIEMLKDQIEIRLDLIRLFNPEGE